MPRLLATPPGAAGWIPAHNVPDHRHLGYWEGIPKYCATIFRDDQDPRRHVVAGSSRSGGVICCSLFHDWDKLRIELRHFIRGLMWTEGRGCTLVRCVSASSSYKSESRKSVVGLCCHFPRSISPIFFPAMVSHISHRLPSLPRPDITLGNRPGPLSGVGKADRRVYGPWRRSGIC
jgi:hypothetical protein